MIVRPFPPLSRRSLLGAGATAGLAATLPGLTTGPARAAQVATPVATPLADAAGVEAVVRAALETYHLQAVLARVVLDGEVIATVAAGEAMTGVPATAEMRVRSGSVAIAWTATALLLLVEQGVVGLDDPVGNWLPDLPNSDIVTLRMLASMTAGYQDYVRAPGFAEQLYTNPFRHWEPEELIAAGLAAGLPYAPGTGWGYSHTSYVILGLALERITGQPLATTLRELVLDPLGLVDTISEDDAPLPEPALHAFTSERRSLLGIPAGVDFIEESTFWNPSWTIARGAIQSATISDMAASAIGFGEGTLLSPAMHEAQVAKSLVGLGSAIDGCPTCSEMTDERSYGLGVVLLGDWIVQTPSFFGFYGAAAYLPSHKLAIATAATYTAAAFAGDGGLLVDNAAARLAGELGALFAPESPLNR